MEESPFNQNQNLSKEKEEYFYDNQVMNLYKNLPFFSYKILEAKYSSTPELYQQMLLNNLIIKKKTHYFAYLNEIAINTNTFKELLKRYYIKMESRERIPKYVSYYQNYLKFFCRPVFGDYKTNKKMVKHMEKVAQIFYNENYADEDEQEQSRKHSTYNFKIFNKSAREEIEKNGDYTMVNTGNDYIMYNQKKMNDNNDDTKYKTIDINKKFFKFKNNDIDLLESIYKITPIFDGNIKNKYKKNKYNDIKEKEKDNSKNSDYNSFQKIIKEMTNKKKGGKIKETANKKNNNNNKLTSHKNIFDYFNSLSSILFSKKKKTSLHKNNSVNNKYNRKKDKINNNSNNNKIINNINININHLTIGQKSSNPLSEMNNNFNYKKGKKRNTHSKTRKHNSMIIKYKSLKNSLNFFGNLTGKNIEYKKRNDSFKISSPMNPILGYNSNKIKKISNINSNSNISNTRNKSNLKGGSVARINNGYSTSLNKVKKHNLKRCEKMMIFTNNINYTKNMFGILDINSSSKKIKHIYNNNSSSINFNSYNNHNKMMNSLCKNPFRAYTPLFLSKKCKYNINTNKGNTFISYERIRSNTNKSKKQKKIFSPKFNSSAGNINFINDSHLFLSPKNILNNNTSKHKMNRNESSHENKSNINSPIFRENIPLGSRNNLALKRKNKEDQKYGYSKALNLKIKNYVKLTNLKKNMKNFSKQIINKSKSKRKKNNNKKK